MSDAPHLVVATPCFGGVVNASFAASMLSFEVACHERGLRWAYAFESGDSLIPRVRANLVTHFLDKKEATHLLFIDADIAFSPDHVFRLLAHDQEFAAVAYPQKRIDWGRIGHAMAKGEPAQQALGLDVTAVLDDPREGESARGLVRAKFVGLGFLMLKRSALVRLCEAHPELRFTSSHTTRRGAPKESANSFALFEPLVDEGSGAYLSEDFSLCQRWRALGGDVWLDLESSLAHEGKLAYEA